MPVVVNGVTLNNKVSQVFNGSAVNKIIFNGTQVFQYFTGINRVWSGDSVAYSSDSNTYAGVNSSGSVIRATYFNGSAWTFGAWVDIDSNGLFIGTGTPQSIATHGFQVIAGTGKMRSCAGGVYSSEYVTFTPGIGFTGSSYATHSLVYISITWYQHFGLETSGGLLRTRYQCTYNGGTGAIGYGAWISLT